MFKWYAFLTFLMKSYAYLTCTYRINDADEIAKQNYTAVSYTHLDVYKRQQFNYGNYN